MQQWSSRVSMRVHTRHNVRVLYFRRFSTYTNAKKAVYLSCAPTYNLQPIAVDNIKYIETSKTSARILENGIEWEQKLLLYIPKNV